MFKRRNSIYDLTEFSICLNLAKNNILLHLRGKQHKHLHAVRAHDRLGKGEGGKKVHSNSKVIFKIVFYILSLLFPTFAERGQKP